jgi:tetratricopeptide (TPR) repeat protein
MVEYRCAIELGILCLQEGKAEGAQDSFGRGIDLCRSLLDKTPNLYEALYYLALAQLSSGHLDEALGTYRRALDVCRARGVVKTGLRDLELLRRMAHPVKGLDESIALLEGAMLKDEGR